MSSPSQSGLSSQYLEHLERGLGVYEERTGRRPSFVDLDVSQQEVRALYDQFRSRPWPRTLGATSAEWLQLRLGLKQVLRERLDRPWLDQLRARCVDEGWFLHVEPLPAPVYRQELEGLDTSPWRAVHAYVGRSADPVLEAAALDSAMPPHQAHVELEQPALASDSQRLGELLGYPPCCTAAFCQWHEKLHDNWKPIAAAAGASQRFEPLLNNLCLGAFHLIAWFPCRYDCPASLAIARRLAQTLSKTRPAQFTAARRPLLLPRIYLDERRQVIFDGCVVDGVAHYQRAFSPFALDRQTSSAAYEWVFYADVVAKVRTGNRAWLEDDVLVVARDQTETARVPTKGAIWLPFGR